MKTIRNLSLALSLLGISLVASAEPETLTAGQVLIACSIATGNDEALLRHRFMCLTPIKAFIAGYRAGGRNGVVTLAQSEAIPTLRPTPAQIEKSSRAAQCVPPVATTEQVADVFVKYMLKRADLGTAEFSGALGDAIKEYFCLN